MSACYNTHTMPLAVKPYKKEYDYSYTLGVYPTMELLAQRPQAVSKVYLHPKGFENEGAQLIYDVCEKNKILAVEDGTLIERLSGKDNVYAVGVFNKYVCQLSEANHTVLVNPSDTGNLGSIIRSMTAFGCRNLAIISPGVDIFDPRAIRASAGSVFGINFEYFAKFEDYSRRFPNHKKYLFMTDGTESLSKFKVTSPCSLVFGNESSGLPADLKKFGETVKIEQTETTDSLNLAVAVGVALHQVFIH